MHQDTPPAPLARRELTASTNFRLSKEKKAPGAYPQSRAIQRLPLRSRSASEATAMQSGNPLSPPATLPNPGDYVSTGEAARILGVSEKTLANWRWRGIGPKASRIGQRLVRYHRADLAAFAAGEPSKADAA